MDRMLLVIVIGGSVALTGCGAKTYTVRFLNNSANPIDFRVDERGVDLDTFADDVPGKGGKVTVIHEGRAAEVTIDSGFHSGQQMLVIDAQCTARVTDGDVVDVVKNPDGSLECTVKPELETFSVRSVTRRVGNILTGR